MSEIAWAQLLSSALVGVGRRPCVLPTLDSPIATVLIGGTLDEAGLLEAAGVVEVARRAGVQPVAVPLPEAAPACDDDARLAPAAALTRLRALLDGGGHGVGDRRTASRLLHEWLREAERRKHTAPAGALPGLLDAGAHDRALRPLVVAVGGATAYWLAARRPREWGWCAPTPAAGEQASAPGSDGDWLDGDAARRAAYLRDLRQHDPAAGRDLLAEAWPAEGAANLALLIGACRNGLGPDDEVWLEKALDDRRAQIRAAAVALLRLLPDSAYATRMADRVRDWIRPQGSKRLAVELPPEYTSDMQRDGIERKPPQGKGERAWWLEQAVAVAPLACWSSVDPDPVAVLARKVNDQLGPTVHGAMANAAVTQNDVTWARALLRTPDVDSDDAALLAALLPPAIAAEEAIHALGSGKQHAHALLTGLAQPWPAEVADAVVIALAANASGRYDGWRTLLSQAELGLPPRYADRVEALAGTVAYGEVLRQLASFLHLRSAIHQEFSA